MKCKLFCKTCYSLQCGKKRKRQRQAKNHYCPNAPSDTPLKKLIHMYLQIDRLWKDRLEHPIVNAEITKFMDKTWMVKEQTEINQS